MPLVENHDIARIRGDLRHCKAKLAGMRAGTVGAAVPEAGETLEQYQARNPHQGRAFENQMNALYVNIAKLESEYVHAMVASGIWSHAQIIAALEPMYKPFITRTELK